MPTIIESLLFLPSRKISVGRHRQKLNTRTAKEESVGWESASVTVETADKLSRMSPW